MYVYIRYLSCIFSSPLVLKLLPLNWSSSQLLLTSALLNTYTPKMPGAFRRVFAQKIQSRPEVFKVWIMEQYRFYKPKRTSMPDWAWWYEWRVSGGRDVISLG